MKDSDGRCTPSRSPTSTVTASSTWRCSRARSGLLDEEDLDKAGGVLEPGCSAGMLVYENVWAAPFARRSGVAAAQVVASGRIPVQALLAAADALDAADSAV